MGYIHVAITKRTSCKPTSASLLYQEAPDVSEQPYILFYKSDALKQFKKCNRILDLAKSGHNTGKYIQNQ